MHDGLEIVMAPVMRGMCSYTDVKTGIIRLEDLLLMCDAIAVENENKRRGEEWASREAKRGR